MIRTGIMRGFAACAVVLSLLLLSSGCKEQSANPEQILADARQERDKGHYRSAIVHLKSLLQKSPQNAEARYLLGVTYNDVGDFKSAEIELRKALDLRYDLAKVKIGKSLLMMGEFQKVLDQVPPDTNAGDAVQAEILTLRAMASFGLNRIPEGRELLEQALAKQPEFADALLAQARLAAIQNKPDEASKLIERALASAPKNVDAWLMKGDLARFRADQAGAMAAYQKVLEISPEDVQARVNMAWQHITASNFDEARKQLEEVRKLAPNLLQRKHLLALIEFQQKKYTVAHDAVLEVLKVAPDYLPSVLLAGAAEYALGTHAQAQAHLGQVVERAPGFLYARKLLIASLAEAGQTQRAIDVLQPSLRQAPEDGALMALAGEVYLRSNEFAIAIQYFEKAAKLDPKSAEARIGLGASRLAAGETDRALADLESAVAVDPNSYRADFLLVLLLLQQANYDQALQAMQSFEKKQPNNPLTYNLKGLIYRNKNEGAAARKAFERALQLQPTFVPAATNLAQLDLEDKQPASARRRLEAILERDKDNTQALLALSNFAARIGATPKEQIDWLERARKASPNSVQPQLMLARAYAKSEDWKKALEVAQQARTARPDDPEVLYTLGATQIGAGANEQAVSTYEKLVALQPKSAAALMQLAKAHAVSGDRTRATNALRKAVSLQPDFTDAQMALAAFELRAKRYSEAMKIAQQVQKRSAKSPAGFVLEGDVLMAERKFPQAVKAYEVAYGMGKSGTVLIKLHAALTRAGKPEEAEGRLAQWLKESPDDAMVRRYRADNHLKSGMYKEAIEDYEWLLKKQPDDAQLLNNLAVAYHGVKDSRALETAERAYKLSPNAAAADTLGWMLVERGNAERGLELLQKAVTDMPKATEPRYHLARALVKTGDRTKARQELEKLLANSPDSRFAKEARELLAELSR